MEKNGREWNKIQERMEQYEREWTRKEENGNEENAGNKMEKAGREWKIMEKSGIDLKRVEENERE